MGRFKTHDFLYRGSEGSICRYKLQININSEGIFTCTLPPEAVETLTSMGVSLQRNRVGNLGFYEDHTMKGLISDITLDFEEAFSRDLVEDIIVMKYWINTRCSYGKRSDGEIIPNLSYDWANGEKDLKWRSGTQRSDSTHASSYGIDVSVRLFNRKTYRYKSGAEKKEYHHTAYMSDDLKKIFKEDHDFQFISGLTAMSIPQHTHSGDQPVREIPYDPDMARLFIGLIKSIININEKIKPFITDDEKLLALAKSSEKLLS